MWKHEKLNVVQKIQKRKQIATKFDMDKFEMVEILEKEKELSPEIKKEIVEFMELSFKAGVEYGKLEVA